MWIFLKDANKEKELRSTIKSEMQRMISQEDVLILDGGNYIKGIPVTYVQIIIPTHFLSNVFITRISI